MRQMRKRILCNLRHTTMEVHETYQVVW